MMDFKLCGNGRLFFTGLMSDTKCFLRIIADIFRSWHRVYTHLNPADRQTTKTSAFIQVIKVADEQLFLGIE